MGIFRDFGSFVIADDWIEGCDQHQGVLKEGAENEKAIDVENCLLNARFIRSNSNDTVVSKRHSSLNKWTAKDHKQQTHQRGEQWSGARCG